MLKITGLSDDLASKTFRVDSNKVVNSGDRADETVVNSSKSKKSKNEKSENSTHIGATRKPTFLTPIAMKVFNRLKQTFTEAPILRHFNSKCHIRIKTNASSYAIGGILSQLSSDWVDPNDLILSKSNFG